MMKPSPRPRRTLGSVVAVCAAVLAVCAPSEAQVILNPPAGTFTQVSTGFHSACAVATNGAVVCWGVPSTIGASTVPAGTFTQVSEDSAALHACAVRTDQTLVCWTARGLGAYTQPTPTGTFLAVRAGDGGACGLRSDQTIVCWGTPSLVGPAFLAPPAGTFTALDISDGTGPFGCALRPDASIACWGFGAPSPPAGTFTSLSLSGVAGCAIRTDGTLACWGQDTVGNTTLGNTSPPAGTFTSLGMNSGGPCAVRTDSTVACWGTDVRSEPPPAGAFAQVSPEIDFACGVRTDQTLTCWPAAAAPPPTPAAAPTASATAPASGVLGARLPRLPAAFGKNGVFVLPSNRSCVSRRHFRIRVRRPRSGVTLMSAVVAVNGRRVAVRKGARLTAPVDLRGLPKGRFTVRISALTADGRAISGTRRYRTCVPRRASGAHGLLALAAAPPGEGR